MVSSLILVTRDVTRVIDSANQPNRCRAGGRPHISSGLYGARIERTWKAGHARTSLPKG